ncbi:MAG: helix-turn-helix domain-containing protein [Acidobacteriaceae bacterium]
MPVEIQGEQYYTNAEVADELKVSRQTLRRWRDKRSIPVGMRYRTRQVLFTAEEVEEIRQFANRLEPIELGSGTARQLGLFSRRSRQEES